MVSSPPTSLNLAGLVRAALEGDAREGITNLLREIASISKSFGCVLWRATQNAHPPDTGELTMLAGWFPVEKSHFGINSAPFKGTIVGAAAHNPRGWELDNDLGGHENPNYDKPFFRKHDLNRVVARRFHYLPRPGEEPRLGVLMVFRRASEPQYSELDAQTLERISEVLPFLYSGARQKASYGLLKEVAEILRKSRQSPKPRTTTPKTERNKILRQITLALASTFHSLEASVFLEDERHPGVYTCAHTSKGCCAGSIRKDSYRPTDSEGFSALSLLAKKQLRVHDWLNPENEVAQWRQIFPSFGGPQRRELADVMLKNLGSPEPPPPLSMMVAPLVADGEALGFLRCWVAKSGPSYFSSDDLYLLRLVADYLSQTVASWRQERRAAESRKLEHQAFTKFATPATPVSRRADKEDMFLAALGLVRQLLPEASFNSVRVRVTNPDRLIYHGYSNDSGYGVPSEELVKRMLSHPQPLPAASLGGTVVSSKKIKMVRGVTQLSKHASDVAAEAGEMMIAPIVVNDRVEGVLDLRTKKGEKFSPQSKEIAGSVISLLALQMAREKAEKQRLAADKERLEMRSRSDRERAESERAMRDAFEDVSHQIKSPLGEAARRVERAGERFQHGAIAQELNSVAKLLRRAELTAKLIGLFANLARGAHLTIASNPHTPVDLVRMVGEICENQRPRISPRRNIRIEFDTESFFRHAPPELVVDSGFLFQALNNLVDNAVKYAYSNTVVRLYGQRLKERGFFIGVINKGIPIEPNEVNLVLQRNWQSRRARGSAGEGTGLGLWIADHIMRAHGGELQVLPTRKTDSITEIRLAFPLAGQ